MPTLRRTVHETPVGALTLTSEDDALSGIFWPGHTVEPQRASLGDPAPGDPFLRQVADQLDEYFAGQRTAFDLPLALHPRSELEAAVWQQIAAIPHGATRSYGEIARRLGSAHLAQAVGGASGRNPVSIVVPCHRVVGSGGGYTGFAGGTSRKAYLLGLEAHVAGDTLFAPRYESQPEPRP